MTEAPETHGDPWRAQALTLFPEMFPGALGASLAGKALAAGLWSLDTLDIRDFARDKHRTVDDAPFGGGAGMVMRADVIDAAIDAAADIGPLIYLTPRGAPFTQARAQKLADGPGVTLLCGRYEGVDQRVLDARGVEEISIGDFVLSGGEAAALTVLDVCVRLLPGVMGGAASLDEESFENGLLEYPLYTRPRVWRDMEPPDILLSGDHGRIAAWRKAQSEAATQQKRPDLWAAYVRKLARRKPQN